MAESMKRWSGKVAVVTGASSGIGAALVERLVAEGLVVVGIARRIHLVEERAKNLEHLPGKLHPLQADLSKDTEILEAFAWIKEHLGPISILVNNAGASFKTGLIDGDVEKWKHILDVNVLGLCVATREAIRSMREGNINNGHIVHLNSILGHKVINYPDLNVYPASKFAVTALAETHRQEISRLGSKIKVTSVSPGLVDTEMTLSHPDLSDEERAFLKTQPVMKPEDIASAIIYALSTPEHVEIQEMIIRPVGETFA